MSIPIRRYPEHQRAAVIRRRSQQPSGLGYWAAVDAERRLAAIAHAAKQKRGERAA